MYDIVVCDDERVLKKLKKHCDFTKDCAIYPKDCEKHRTCAEYRCVHCDFLIKNLEGKTVLSKDMPVENAAKAMNYTNYSFYIEDGEVNIEEIRDYHILPSLVSYSIKPVPKRSCIQCEHIKYAKSNIDTAYCSKLDKEVPIKEILSNIMDGCPEPNVTTKK